jgi:hypothetical protein
MMRALDPEVHDAVFEAVKGHIVVPVDTHPLGCHRRRISDRVCFRGILIRLVTGAAWTTVEVLMNHEVSDTTLRTRRDEWIANGVFDALAVEALAAYDHIVGFDLTNVAIDGSNHKAPCGGEQTGFNPTDRGKQGWKWLIAVDAAGIPLTWVTAGANRNDYALLKPILGQLQDADLATVIGTLHLDRGFGYKSAPAVVASYGIANLDVIARRQPNQGPGPLVGLGKRWIVEAANSWLSNHGQLRRSTDRRAAICLAVTILITARLLDWATTHHNPRPIR